MLEIKEFKSEMEFVVKNTLMLDKDVEGLLNLKDSIFLNWLWLKLKI